MITTHTSYINTTRVSWCKRHTAEGNRGLSRGDTTALLKLLFAFSSLPSTHLSLFPKKYGSAVHPWEHGVGEEGCVLPRRVWDEIPWCVTHALPCQLLSSPLFTLAISQSEGLGNYLFPDTNACSCQILYSLLAWERFYLRPRNPEPKVYKKDWIFQKLSLSEHRWYQVLGTLQLLLVSSSFPSNLHSFRSFLDSLLSLLLLVYLLICQLQFFLIHFSSLWISLLLSKASFFLVLCSLFEK